MRRFPDANTVTVADPLRVGWATDVATMWYVPASDGAVYVPFVAIEPPAASCTLHVTAWFAGPVTPAVKVIAPRVPTVAAPDTVTTASPSTVSVAAALVVLPALLLTTTV